MYYATITIQEYSLPSNDFFGEIGHLLNNSTNHGGQDRKKFLSSSNHVRLSRSSYSWSVPDMGRMAPIYPERHCPVAGTEKLPFGTLGLKIPHNHALR